MAHKFEKNKTVTHLTWAPCAEDVAEPWPLDHPQCQHVVGMGICHMLENLQNTILGRLFKRRLDCV